jgi:hypothetical protein
MSYSRWSDSVWYTFWDAYNSGETKNTQVFNICDFRGDLYFTYSELKNDLVGCLSKVGTTFPETTPEELLELKTYMLWFIADVEQDYGL